jgi:hypothetical protein
MTIDPNQLEQFEEEFDLFSIEVNDVPIWERIRFNTFREIRRTNGLGRAHTQTGEGLKEHFQGIALWARNAIYRNPYFADKHEFLFFGHQRRKLEGDGYWWDLYCDPIHNREELNYLHLEAPHGLSHRTPAKTQNLRYSEFIRYTGTIQRKLGLRTPSVPKKVVSRLHEAESAISSRFNIDLSLVTKTEHTLHVRNTALPLYERLLERINPSVVVVVVAYGKETLIEACKRKDIPVVELQHGVIYDDHFEYSYPEDKPKTTFPDYLLTFGEFWTENVRFPIPDERVIPVGYPYLEGRLDAYDDVKSSDQLLFISQGTIGHELSQFALAVHEDPRIDHEVVYKLHPGEYDRWRDKYPQLAGADVRVIDEPEPPLYQLFAESSAQIGVGSTAVYEGLCFDLETFVFDTDGAEVLRPLVEDGTASLIRDVDGLAVGIGSMIRDHFDQEWFFESDAGSNIIQELRRIKPESL